MKLTAIILTKNEEANIVDCINSIKHADEILVLDSGSTDRTVELASARGARCVYNHLIDFADQREKGMRLARGEWILFIDADERLSEGMYVYIQYYIYNSPRFNFHNCFSFPRLNMFFGKPLKFLSRGDEQIRLIRKGSGKWKGEVHEKFVPDGPISKIPYPIIHHGTKNFKEWKRKFDLYIPLEHLKMALKAFTSKSGLGEPLCLFLLVKPPLKFLYLYFLRLGILDGWTGFLYCVLASLYDFMKYFIFIKCNLTQEYEILRYGSVRAAHRRFRNMK